MHLVNSPKFCITIVLNFSWDDSKNPREIENNGYVKVLRVNKGKRVNKVNYGLCENGELPSEKPLL